MKSKFFTSVRSLIAICAGVYAGITPLQALFRWEFEIENFDTSESEPSSRASKKHMFLKFLSTSVKLVLLPFQYFKNIWTETGFFTDVFSPNASVPTAYRHIAFFFLTSIFFCRFWGNASFHFHILPTRSLCLISNVLHFVNFSDIQSQTAVEHDFKGGDEVAFFAKVWPHPTYFCLGTLANQLNFDSVCRILHEKTLISITSIDAVEIRPERIYFKYARLLYL